MLVVIIAALLNMAQEYKQLDRMFAVAGTTFFADPSVIADPGSTGFVHTQLRIERLNVSARVAMGLRLLREGRGIFPDLSVAENIAVVAARNDGAAAMFGIADVYRLFPVLDERRPTRAGSLSGGQQQMLALALAILGSPRCLLLDEPSIGLAPNLVELLFQQVHDVCKSHAMTAILVEQNVAAAMKIADRVIIMNNGPIVFDGLPQEARDSNFWHYFHS